MSKARPCRYLLVLCAAIALVVATGLYARHSLADPLHAHSSHCDLCLHMAGTAGSPPKAAVTGRPVLATWVIIPSGETLLVVRRKTGPHPPRGPPHSLS